MIKNEYLITYTNDGPMIGTVHEAVFPHISPKKTKYVKNKVPEWFLMVQDIIYTVQKEYVTHNPLPDAYKRATEILGITPKKYYEYYCAQVISYWYGDKETKKRTIANKLCLTKKGLTAELSENFRDMYNEIEQCFDTDQAHLAPFVMYMYKDVTKLQRSIDKEVWNKLCNNSFSRNLHMAKLVSKYNIPMIDVIDLPAYWLKCPALLSTMSDMSKVTDLSKLAIKRKKASNLTYMQSLVYAFNKCSATDAIHNDDIIPFLEWNCDQNNIYTSRNLLVVLSLTQAYEEYRKWKRTTRLKEIKKSVLITAE